MKIMNKLKIALYSTVVSICCLSSASVYAEAYFNRNQVIITENGIFVDMDGSLMRSECLFYEGNGVFSSPRLAGDCCQCGSRRGPDGKCENPHCNNSGRNGPRERD